MVTTEDIVRIQIDFALVACDQLRGVAVDYLHCAAVLHEVQDHFQNCCDNLRSLLSPGEMRISIIGNRLYEISRDHADDIQVRELVRKAVMQ